jgi:hypothetical protein
MNLSVSGSTFQNASYQDASTGRILYKVDTPWKVMNHTTTISKLLTVDLPHTSASGDEELGESHLDAGAPRFAHLATIEWALLGPSTVRYKGEVTGTGMLFRKGGMGLSGRYGCYYLSKRAEHSDHMNHRNDATICRDRIFKGPDGKEYRWDLEVVSPTVSMAYLSLPPFLPFSSASKHTCLTR